MVRSRSVNLVQPLTCGRILPKPATRFRQLRKQSWKTYGQFYTILHFPNWHRTHLNKHSKIFDLFHLAGADISSTNRFATTLSGHNPVLLCLLDLIWLEPLVRNYQWGFMTLFRCKYRISKILQLFPDSNRSRSPPLANSNCNTRTTPSTRNFLHFQMILSVKNIFHIWMNWSAMKSLHYRMIP